MKSNTYKNILYFIIFILIVSILYYSDEQWEDVRTSVKTRTLAKDGFVVLHDDRYRQTVDKPCSALHNDVLAMLPPGYEFIDYVYQIHNVALSTFHRDVTSSQKIYHTRWPVYTLILYQYDGELLSLCPGSHSSYPFVWSRIVNIHGTKGTAFLFDCDVLHAGCINQCKERKVIQYKICHREDRERLSHLSGVRMTKTDVCQLSFYSLAMRKMSYYFEFPVNYLFYPLMTKRESDDSMIGKIQGMIPIKYYNN